MRRLRPNVNLEKTHPEKAKIPDIKSQPVLPDSKEIKDKQSYLNYPHFSQTDF
jgi:hypothetical protein